MKQEIKDAKAISKENRVCINCGKEFFALRTKRTKWKPLASGIRSVRDKTCSKRCSREFWNNRSRKKNGN